MGRFVFVMNTAAQIATTLKWRLFPANRGVVVHVVGMIMPTTL